MNYLKVHAYDCNTDTLAFSAFLGKYKDFEISIRDNKLYCIGRFGRTFYLTPIEGNVFLGLDWLQLEFLQTTGGKASQLKLLGKPGWEEILERTE